MINILAFQQPSGGFYHRVKTSLLFFDKKEFNIAYTLDLRNEKDFEGIDILYIYSTGNIPAYYVSLLQLKYGFKIIVDVDDTLNPPPLHPNYDTFHNGRKIKTTAGYQKTTPLRTLIQDYVILADVVIASTKEVKEEYSVYNNNIHVVPNRIPFEQLQFVENYTPSDKLRIGIIGSISHYYDWQLLKPCLQKIKNNKRLMNKLQFVVGGWDAGNERSRMYWDKLLNMFPGSVIKSKTLSVDNYMEHYDKIDVILAPLENNTMNKCKSSLKVLEAASKNVLFIGSDLYKTKTDAIYAILYENWYDHIEYFSTLSKEELSLKKREFSSFVINNNPFLPIVAQKQEICKSIL